MHDMPAVPGNAYHHIQISGNARVLLENAVGQATGQSDPASLPFSHINSPQSSLSPPAPTIRGIMPTRRSDRSAPTSRARGYIRRSKKPLHDQNSDQEDDARIVVVYGLGSGQIAARPQLYPRASPGLLTRQSFGLRLDRRNRSSGTTSRCIGCCMASLSAWAKRY